MTSAFSWQNLISLCPASFHTLRPILPVTPGVSWLPTFAFQSPIMKKTSFGGVNSRRSCKIFFVCGSSVQRECSMKVTQLLGLRGLWWLPVCRDTDCLRRKSHGPIRVFFRASCSWRSAGLFGQSFSIALPIQALRGVPCLASFSVVWHVKHMERPPWLGPYSVGRFFRHLKGSPGGILLCTSVGRAFDGQASLLLSCQWWCVERKRLWSWLQLLHVIQQYCLASKAAWLSSTGISHYNLLSNPLNPALCSQQQPLHQDCSTILKLQLPATAPSRRLVFLPSIYMAFARTVWFSFHSGCHRSAVSLSALNVSPLTQTIAPLWGSDSCSSFPTCQV